MLIARKILAVLSLLGKTIDAHGEGLHALPVHCRNNKGIVSSFARWRARTKIMACQYAFRDDSRTVILPRASAEKKFLPFTSEFHEADVVILGISGGIEYLDFR